MGLSNRKIVIALGGNAILTTDASAEAQKQALERTAEYIVQFVENGDDIIVTHGNGPQVGNLLLQQSAADTPKNPAMRLDTCVAMTQGSIGYWLQLALSKAIHKRGLTKEVVSLVTLVEVSESDPAFRHPTKPIGPFLSKEEAEAEMQNTDATFIEDAGRGWRKVVPSPRPVKVKEVNVVDMLVNQGVIPITVGGGGVALIKDEHSQFKGVEAVIDKDFASQTLAASLKADLLVILTGVENVLINYQKPDEKKLEEVSVEDMKQYIHEKQFLPGSMLPKVEAAVSFVEANPAGKAVITSLENIQAVINEKGGTIITSS
ncbi:carbamate kinase [Alkalibacterium psychrotolerans]